MDKIYSRNKRIYLPKFNGFHLNGKMNLPCNKDDKKKRKVIGICFIIIIALCTANYVFKAISPIVDKQCLYMAKIIATRVSNEQASVAMQKYKYHDICDVTKDANGSIAMISANSVTVNEMISDITLKIQEELSKGENSKFYISMGSFTGSRLLSGSGPRMEIQMGTIGTIETKLKSVFTSSGINQTLHKIYLELNCEVSILTPFHTVEQNIINEVLLTEAVIIGTTPNTYYNFEGENKSAVLEAIE